MPAKKSSQDPRCVLVTGAQAAGKSTVGRLLAERMARGVFIEGDLIWKMVVAGRVDMSAAPDEEALRQLRLRYQHGAMLAESYVANGFMAVHVDNIYGDEVRSYLDWLSHPASLIVLRPQPFVIAEREKTRGSTAYAGWVRDGVSLLDAVTQFDGWVAETPRVGLWIDTSDQSPSETVDEIIQRWDETFVPR